MLRLLGLVLSIGFADALNPSTIGPALYLAGGERPARSVIAFTLGIFGVFVLGGALVALGPGQALLAVIPKPGPTVRYLLETSAGAAMLVAAALLWLKRRRLADRGNPGGPPKSRRGALWGATIGVVELPTAFPYFAVIVAIVGSGLGVGQQLLLVVIYNLCFVAPMLVIAALLVIAPERAGGLLERLRAFLQARWPVVLAVLAALAGVFVLALGVTGLLGRSHGHVGRVSRRLRHLLSH